MQFTRHELKPKRERINKTTFKKLITKQKEDKLNVPTFLCKAVELKSMQIFAILSSGNNITIITIIIIISTIVIISSIWFCHKCKMLFYARKGCWTKIFQLILLFKCVKFHCLNSFFVRVNGLLASINFKFYVCEVVGPKSLLYIFITDRKGSGESSGHPSRFENGSDHPPPELSHPSRIENGPDHLQN